MLTWAWRKGEMFGGRRRGAIEQSHAGLEPGDLRNMAALFYQDREKETASASAALMPCHTQSLSQTLALLLSSLSYTA